MNRRDFIKAGTGAFFIASADRLFGAGAPSERVRLAIVGCHQKGRGFQVMKAAMKVPGAEIAWICDVDRRAREFASEYVFKETGVRPRMEMDLRKVLEDKTFDAVVSETLHLDPKTGDCLTKAGAERWSREYAKGWELA